MKSLFFLLFLFICSLVNGQDLVKYYHYEKLSDESFQRGDLEDAGKYIDSALEYKFEIVDYYKAAYTFYLLKNFEKCKKYLLSAAKSGMSFPDFAAQREARSFRKPYGFSYEDIDILKLKIPNFVADFQAKSAETQRMYNLRYLLELHDVFVKDQGPRILQPADATCEHNFRLRSIREIDSMNIFQLQKLVKIYGFPDLTFVSDKGLYYFMFVIGHSLTSSNETIANICKEYMEELKKLVIKGKMRNEGFANMVDRYYHFTFKQNYYGKFYDPSEAFFEKEKVHQRRQEIGLPPLSRDIVIK